MAKMEIIDKFYLQMNARELPSNAGVDHLL